MVASKWPLECTADLSRADRMGTSRARALTVRGRKAKAPVDPAEADQARSPVTAEMLRAEPAKHVVPTGSEPGSRINENRS